MFLPVLMCSPCNVHACSPCCIPVHVQPSFLGLNNMPVIACMWEPCGGSYVPFAGCRMPTWLYPPPRMKRECICLIQHIRCMCAPIVLASCLTRFREGLGFPRHLL